MELYQLRSFLAVAQEGNLTRAAERLFSSQPSVSAHIKALEDESGLRLFDRLPTGMKLTAEGERLRDHAARILDAADHFRSAAQDLRRSVSGELVLAMNNQPKVLRMTEVLARLAREHTALSFRLVYASSASSSRGSTTARWPRDSSRAPARTRASPSTTSPTSNSCLPRPGPGRRS